MRSHFEVRQGNRFYLALMALLLAVTAIDTAYAAVAAFDPDWHMHVSGNSGRFLAALYDALPPSRRVPLLAVLSLVMAALAALCLLAALQRRPRVVITAEGVEIHQPLASARMNWQDVSAIYIPKDYVPDYLELKGWRFIGKGGAQRAGRNSSIDQLSANGKLHEGTQGDLCRFIAARRPDLLLPHQSWLNASYPPA